jgi:acyl-coenzyme A synthetase/AMP-(fatty) acid ligase
MASCLWWRPDRNNPVAVGAWIRISKDVWTYKRLAVEVERLARGLVKRGLREGNRVALHMTNVAELVVAYYACFRIGVVAAPLNTKLKFAELRPPLEQLQPALYIGQAELYGRIAALDTSIIPSNARYIIGDSVDDPWVQSWRTLLEDGDDVEGCPLNAGHFFPEEIPNETADALNRFFAAAS